MAAGFVDCRGVVRILVVEQDAVGRAVDSGQYDDLDGPAHSILFDDQDPNHTAAVDEANAGKPDDKAPPHA